MRRRRAFILVALTGILLFILSLIFALLQQDVELFAVLGAW